MEDFMKDEFSDEFIALMKSRVRQSYYKYGAARKNFAEGRVDALATAMLCIDAFQKDGNGVCMSIRPVVKEADEDAESKAN